MEPKALVVDLTSKQIEEQEFPRRYLDQYLGGRGLGIRLLHDYVDATIDPLGPENCMMFVAGPLQGTSAFYTSKSVLQTKSPLSGTPLFSIASGSLSHNLARTGYSALVIKGKADRPTHLLVRDNRVEFKDASKLWGLTTDDAEHFLRQTVPDEASIALIGPAGERLVRYACIVTEGKRHQAFGRGGTGAVMGSKNLKAVSILGTGKVLVADAAAVKEAQRHIIEKIAAAPGWRTAFRRFGTPGGIAMLNTIGILPTRQWHTGQIKNIEPFEAERLHDEWYLDNQNCGPYCPNPCFHWMTVRDGEYRGALTFGPEYETLYAFGTNLENTRVDSVIAVDQLCDSLGLDTMSTGLTIGWATECAERGVLSPGDLDGLNLRFGDHVALRELVRKIAYREGIGDLLAEGSQRAAQKVGRGSEAWVITAKGLELGGYECRASWGQAIQFALSHRGGCHQDLGLPARDELGSPQATRIEGQGDHVRNSAFRAIVFSSAVMCTFPQRVLGLETAGKLLSAVTGDQYDVPRLREIGERILNAERLYLAKAGFRRADDRLPEKLLKEPLPDGPGRGNVVPLEELKDEFYRSSGWDLETGIPTVETLQRLGIELRLASGAPAR